MLGVSRTKLCG
ncbi:hypothetical protein YPPY02_2920, partial [Yersinia pestis PY-02]